MFGAGERTGRAVAFFASRKTECKKEQLVEHQPALCRRKRGVAFRQMNVAQRIAERGQVVFTAYFLG